MYRSLFFFSSLPITKNGPVLYVNTHFFYFSRSIYRKGMPATSKGSELSELSLLLVLSLV